MGTSLLLLDLDSSELHSRSYDEPSLGAVASGQLSTWRWERLGRATRVAGEATRAPDRMRRSAERCSGIEDLDADPRVVRPAFDRSVESELLEVPLETGQELLFLLPSHLLDRLGRGLQ